MTRYFRLPSVAAAALLAFALGSNLRADIVTFQDKATDLSSVTFVENTSFSSGGVDFSSQNQPFGTGFAYSRVSDLTDRSYTNPYASATGAGSGDNIYGVYFGYKDSLPASPTLADLQFESFSPFTAPLQSITLPAGMGIQSIDVNNTIFAVDVMQHGNNPFARAFAADDFFHLTIYGVAANDAVIGSVTVNLADFENGNSFIMTDWTTVDLSSLSQANRLFFNLTSTDTGVNGMNTPGYFALDNIVFAAVPEPSTLALALGGVVLAGFWVRRRARTRSQAAALDAASAN